MSESVQPAGKLPPLDWPFTINVTVVLCTREPLVPVMVTVFVLEAIVLVVVMVNVEEPDPLIVARLKLAVAPAGKPLAVSVTLPLNQFSAVTVAV